MFGYYQKQRVVTIRSIEWLLSEATQVVLEADIRYICLPEIVSLLTKHHTQLGACQDLTWVQEVTCTNSASRLCSYAGSSRRQTRIHILMELVLPWQK